MLGYANRIPADVLHGAALWRHRVEEILDQRETMIDLETRTSMLRLAATYDRLAELEDRQAGMRAEKAAMVKIAAAYERLIAIERSRPRLREV